MKRLLVVLAAGLLAGCEYTVPLVTSPTIEIDRSVVGLWQTPGENGETHHLLVLPLDQHEYLVSYPSGAEDGLFFRACLCRVGDQSLVQLKCLGTAKAELPNVLNEARVFLFLAYSLEGDKLTVRLLNTEVVKTDVASTEDLAKSITANRDNPNLFKQSATFTKISD
jgi:hypothetical protein